jgi:hypothetical protein
MSEISQISVINNILTGSYYRSAPSGKKGKLFAFSSIVHPVDEFQPPYDAMLPSGNAGNLAVAQRIRAINDPISSDRSGVLYYSDSPDLAGTCHGYGRTILTFYTGANFYQAFYPAGYFSPPFGETVSIYKSNQDGHQALVQGSCAPMSVTEYNETFGIVSKTASDSFVASSTLASNAFQPIHTPAEVCPDVNATISNYYNEINYNLIPGTTLALGATTNNNSQPIPTSLDSTNIKLDGRYKLIHDASGKTNTIQFNADGRPTPSYSSTDQTTKLNNPLCLAQIMETQTAIGKGTNSIQMLEAPDAVLGAGADQVSFAGADDWHYWHFLFRENASSMPFYNDFVQTTSARANTVKGEGTQLFLPVLSSEDYYWQNRQCPDAVDYLPWTFGASIYACPSEHFDVPYYAAIKKFGFYGARFLNSCTRLNLENPLSGVANAVEPISPSVLAETETEPDDVDAGGNWNFQAYDNLLQTAKLEERYSNMYALNKGFFLWANLPYITNEPEYAQLYQNNSFVKAFSGLLNKFYAIYPSGISSFSGAEPSITLDSAFSLKDSGSYSDLLSTNDSYKMFRGEFDTVATGSDAYNWGVIEDKYGSYITSGAGKVNEAFYSGVVSGREKRLMTRYLENNLRGNPVDLFPLNSITFSFDKAKDYLEHTGWARSVNSVGGNTIPEINRRYFEGAYGNSTQISGLTDVLNKLTFKDTTAYYPGFFNSPDFNKDLPKTTYIPVESGVIQDDKGRRFSPSGWLAAGYNEIGKLDENFSCFTPLFIQQPLDKVYCKIGQAPTFRAKAVDYHTIPDDKISNRYPEIMYWATKLKLVDNNNKNLYPVKYKWFRVPQSVNSGFFASGDFTQASESNPSGDWCCLEGDGCNCTVIHPKECSPVYSSKSVDDYTFIKGSQKNHDDKYYYYCMASGRFGVRMSEKSEIKIEDWLRFDVSFKHGINVTKNTLSVSFEVNDLNGKTQTVDVLAKDLAPYLGYQFDETAIPEAVVEQKRPPPNAGFGDVTAFRFIGPIGYVGATRSYKPATLSDTRGLREQWGSFLEYGALVPFETSLTQQQGELLYGYKHLPVCDNYSMANGKKGIKVIAKVGKFKVAHWTLRQKAFAATTSLVGMQWDKLSHVGELYPPAVNSYEIDSPNKGIGHWQWGNNLGAIKRFGYNSKPQNGDITFSNLTSSQPSQDMIDKVKKKLLTPSTLAGWNCGYSAYGMGRNMLYFIEAYDRFFAYCDPMKKKNVSNLSFMCPGLRYTNSATQYFWLGHPNNTYVERRPMYGPYAYQWRVKRHNRDRNGNGISEGFYSMGWGKRYEALYDAPAIYGLYLKYNSTPELIQKVKDLKSLRDAAFATQVNDLSSIRSVWFGEKGGEGGAKPYGNFMYSCDPTSARYNEAMCSYTAAAKELAGTPDFKAYQCPEDLLKAGKCFDPCLSIRYGQGFFPAGKNQNMFGYEAAKSSNLRPKKVRLVSMANLDQNNQIITSDEQSTVDKDTYFRSPVNTPHALIMRGETLINKKENLNKEQIAGIAPCKDGGADHCNYMTPTIHLGTSSSTLIGTATAFSYSANYVANLYASFNINGAED